MIIKCPGCSTQFYLKEDNLPQGSFKLRCSSCRKVFTSEGLRPGQSPSEKQPPRTSPDSKAQAQPRPGAAAAAKDAKQALARPPVKRQGLIIAIGNQKGGVAKTSTCLNLGMALASQGKRVLLVDFDIQGNLTSSLGERTNTSLYHVAGKKREDLLKIISKTSYENVWLLPSNPKMALLGRRNNNGKRPMHVLKGFLSNVRRDFDFILVDTPPSIEFFTLNALIAADFIIIPSQCESFSMHGVGQMEKAINYIRKKESRKIEYRVLVTMYDADKTAARVVHENIKRRYKGKAFRTVIEVDHKISESQIVGQPVIVYDPESQVAAQYQALAGEVLKVHKPASAGAPRRSRAHA